MALQKNNNLQTSNIENHMKLKQETRLKNMENYLNMSFQISCLLNLQVWLPLARLGFRTPTDSVKVADTLWVGRKRLDLAGGWLLEYDVLRHD